MRAIIQGRISDNVLEPEDHTTFTLHLIDELVDTVEDITGVYDPSGLVGRSIKELADWTEMDDTGRHPETYHELLDPITNKYRDSWSPDDIREALAY